MTVPQLVVAWRPFETRAPGPEAPPMVTARAPWRVSETRAPWRVSETRAPGPVAPPRVTARLPLRASGPEAPPRVTARVPLRASGSEAPPRVTARASWRESERTEPAVFLREFLTEPATACQRTVFRTEWFPASPVGGHPKSAVNEGSLSWQPRLHKDTTCTKSNNSYCP